MKIIIDEKICILFIVKLINCLNFQTEYDQAISEIDPTVVLKKLITTSRINCLLACKKNVYCEYVGYNSSTCILYSPYAKFYTIKDYKNTKLYKKATQKKLGLSHYWPIAGGEARELISSKDLYGAINMSYVPDRFGNKNSAFKLESGYFQAPSGFYFADTFTISIWIKLKKYSYFQRIIDFSNGISQDSIIITFKSYEPKIAYNNFNSDKSYILYSKCDLNLNTWYHLTFVSEPNKMIIYVNGTLDSSLYSNETMFRTINRTLNYFGKSQWNQNAYAEMAYDDIKFYNRILDESEIYDEFLLGLNQ